MALLRVDPRRIGRPDGEPAADRAPDALAMLRLRRGPRPAPPRAAGLDACVCSNRTCEIGLQQATGRPYASFVFLLEELTRPGY